LITTEIFYILLLTAIALLAARFFGFIFYKFKQPAVLGEIIAGVILGAIVLFYFSGQKFVLFNSYTFFSPNLNFHSNEFNLLAEIGILFLLFISGLETSISKLKKTGKSSVMVAIGGVIAPLIFGYISGILLGLSTIESIVIGLILTATSVGVTIRTLMDLDVLDSEVGATILGAAVIDDIIAIVLLAFAMGGIATIADAAMVGIRIAIFFLVFLYIGLKVIDKVLDISEKIHLPKAFLSIALAILLIYAFFADKAGISGIIGAFVAGILIGQNFRAPKITNDAKAVGYGFFIPIFFVWVGTTMWKDGNFLEDSSLISIAILAVILIIIGVIGKIIGCGIAAKITGLSNRESLQIGVGMIPRMELALIIVTAAISKNLISTDFAHIILASTILLTIITTLITPILIKATFKNK